MVLAWAELGPRARINHLVVLRPTSSANVNALVAQLFTDRRVLPTAVAKARDEPANLMVVAVVSMIIPVALDCAMNVFLTPAAGAPTSVNRPSAVE